MGESSKRKRKANKKKKTTKAWEKIMSRFTDDLWIEIFLQEDSSCSLFHLGLGRAYKNLKFPYSDGEYAVDPTSKSYGEYPVEPRSKLIGSDCGIVCISVDLDKWNAAKNKCDIYLWNPETRHSKVIPPYTISDHNRCTSTLGFGFDHIGFDFKVVRVVRRARSLVAEVYSSNRNGWRKIGSKPNYVADSHVFARNYEFDVCFHGFLFDIERNSGMMAFDLNKELFIWDINLPVSSFDDADSYIETRVADFKDSVAVTLTHMEEGVTLNYVGGFFNNVQLALDNEVADGFLYDLNKKVATYFPEHPYFETCEISKYTKSLFSLEGFKRIKWCASRHWDEDMDE
ncbi:hypothetical protein POM88_037294 [Heracleum sosnowskyi]|uniref:F-box associated beta-propeller type 3 domain-containing protein n=1 Tax=Heracleum sosnowskyi TaxID=360622 RepID=A0AAD8HRR9_9APIA|nr:hypothetical protein POM88_037294 [Heracleum sosnowskyi]